MKRPHDQVAIINGGAGCIDEEAAARFLEEDASVVLVDIDQGGPLNFWSTK